VTVAAARRAIAQALRNKALDTPELDARLLVGHVLGLDHAGLVAVSGRALSDNETAMLTRLAARRSAHEPIARITGRKEFWGLDLEVTAATLVPRPETETLVEAALATVDRGGRRDRPLTLADLGTGTGALMLALLTELPRAIGIGTDRACATLDVARDNARQLGLAGRALFVTCDYGSALRGPFDLVVSNPPYVPTAEIATLDADVRDYDPLGALDGGTDGLDAYRSIAADTRRLLAGACSLVLELGAGQEHAVAALFARAGLGVAGPARRDLADIPRALEIRP
jgi:release factor glutamine methyltransferase